MRCASATHLALANSPHLLFACMQFSFELATLELRFDICSFGDHQRYETQPSPLKLLVPYNCQEVLQLVITASK